MKKWILAWLLIFPLLYIQAQDVKKYIIYTSYAADVDFKDSKNNSKDMFDATFTVDLEKLNINLKIAKKGIDLNYPIESASNEIDLSWKNRKVLTIKCSHGIQFDFCFLPNNKHKVIIFADTVYEPTQGREVNQFIQLFTDYPYNLDVLSEINK